jgi:hypothetical protein
VKRWNSKLMTLNFPDQFGEIYFTKTDQVVMADNENTMQRALLHVT